MMPQFFARLIVGFKLNEFEIHNGKLFFKVA